MVPVLYCIPDRATGRSVKAHVAVVWAIMRCAWPKAVPGSGVVAWGVVPVVYIRLASIIV